MYFRIVLPLENETRDALVHASLVVKLRDLLRFGKSFDENRTASFIHVSNFHSRDSRSLEF